MMNTLIHWIDPDLVQALGWTLLHSLWQGGAIALLLAVGLIMMRKSSATTRYWVSMSSLLLLLGTTVVTFTMIYEPGPEMALSTPHLTDVTQQDMPKAGADFVAQPVLSATNHPTVYTIYFEEHLPLLVTAWLLGVLLLCLRMLGEIAYIQHLKNYRCRAVNAVWSERLQLMCDELKIRRKVQLKETFRVHAPMVVGAFKPIILFPIGLLANLPTDQVESILAHELAHIRRHDYLVNLFQALVEILLFFNPAMWWISGKIKAEREHSCDDLAVNMTGDTLAFVKSLARLEEWRLQGHAMAMSFTGQQHGVLGRIQRLVNRDDKRKIPAKAFWSLSVVGICIALLCFQATPVESQNRVESTQAVEEPVVPTPNEPLESGVEPTVVAHEVAEVEARPAEVISVLEEEELSPAQDSVPEEELARLEIEMARMQQEMEAKMQEMNRQMNALQTMELTKQKELQLVMQDKHRKLMELEVNLQRVENEKQLLEQQFDIDESDLSMEQLHLDQMRQELDQKRELLEQQSDRLSHEDIKKRLQELQNERLALLENEKALRIRKHGKEKALRETLLQHEKAVGDLERSHTKMEQELELLERDHEMERLKLEQQRENLSVDQELLERNLDARQRALDEKAQAIERRLKAKQKQE